MAKEVRCCEGCGRDTRKRFCERCEQERRDEEERERLEYLRQHRGEEPYRREVE